MYQMTETTSVTRLSDGAIIPADPANSDWRDYRDWLDRGNAPLPVPVIEPDPIETAKAELAALDPLLPRAIEDLIMVLGIDQATLPAIMRDRLDRKRALRALLQTG